MRPLAKLEPLFWQTEEGMGLAMDDPFDTSFEGGSMWVDLSRQHIPLVA